MNNEHTDFRLQNGLIFQTSFHFSAIASPKPIVCLEIFFFVRPLHVEKVGQWYLSNFRRLSIVSLENQSTDDHLVISVVGLVIRFSNCYFIACERFQCQCLDGFLGADCSEEVEQCRDISCENGGECVYVFDVYPIDKLM